MNIILDATQLGDIHRRLLLCTERGVYPVDDWFPIGDPLVDPIWHTEDPWWPGRLIAP